MKNKLSLLTFLALTMVLGALAACTPGAAGPEEGAAAATLPAESTAAPDAAQPKTVTFFVGPELAECTGVAPQMCMMVKQSPEEEYSFFYSQIDGFTFEPGFEYELKVEVTPVANAPADASSLSYQLIEVVSKTPVETEATSELEGTRWTLVDYVDDAGNTVAAVPGVDAAIEFSDGTVSGTAGCNSFSGGYTVDGNALTIGPMATTLMACMDEGVMQQESAVTANLQAAATYTIEGDVLTIANAEGTTTLTFQAAEPISLTGTNWAATNFNNGKEAVVSLMVDTTITADFGEDGTLSGNAGCNDYNASYTVDGNSITIQPAASTRMFCGEPEGLMDQEAQYLQALTTAATYEISGTTLTLRTADGAMVANYMAAAADEMSTNQAPDDVLLALGNATYPLTYDPASPDSITLVDGEYHAPVAPDSAEEIVVTMTDHSAYGQLENGEDIAAVVLTTSTGGSGTFYDLAVVTFEDGVITNVATTYLGDRVTINSVSIVDDLIVVDMLTQGPDEPLCCGTMPVVQSYRLVDGKLELVAG